MGDAGHEVALRPEGEEPVRSDPIESIVESYLYAADGDARNALRQALGWAWGHRVR